MPEEKKPGFGSHILSYVGKFGGRKFAAMIIAIAAILNLPELGAEQWLVEIAAYGIIILATAYILATAAEDVAHVWKNGKVGQDTPKPPENEGGAS